MHFDSLRAATILYIISVGHIDDYVGDIFNNPVDDFLTLIFLGIFFYISGHLLSSRYTVLSLGNAINFYKKRLLRIYPLFFLTVPMFAVIYKTSVPDVLCNLVFLNVLLNNSMPTLWFVSLICFFYLLLPLILYHYHTGKALAIGILLPPLAMALHSASASALVDIRFAVYFPVFIMGAMSGRRSLSHAGAKPWLPPGAAIPMLALSVLLFALQGHGSGLGDHAPLAEAVIILSALPACLAAAAKLPRALHASLPVRTISYASYCIYLGHRIVYQVMVHFIPQEAALLRLMVLFLIGIPVTVAAGYLVQRGYDRLLAAATP